MFIFLLYMFTFTHIVCQHTVHNVTSNIESFCQFSHVLEKGFYLGNYIYPFFSNEKIVDKYDKNISTFLLLPNIPFSYGLVITNQVDFNLLYSLTCMLSKKSFSQTPKVCFVVGANGPADPNIQILNYYGAQGKWVINPGIGENFYIIYT